jgi:Ca-activated chloride channel family protein
MKGARLVFVIVTLAAVVAAIVYSMSGTKNKSASTTPGQTTTQAPAVKGEVKITLAYSPEKELMLTDLTKRFNAESHVAAGKKIVVDIQNWSSGKAETDIAQGRFQPTIWSPSSSLWGRLLNYESKHSYIGDVNPSLVRTPLVIAMWKHEAQALGWPNKPVGFAQILALAKNPKGFAAVGHPELGEFKLGHTNPDYSTSGLSFIAATYYAEAGKKEGLTIKDIQRVRAQAQSIEQSIVHYGDTTLFFADQLKAHGPGYASAVAMEEATLVDFNRTRPPGVEQMVAIYPTEGTFYSDDPYLVLNAPWVSPAQTAAAKVYGDWLQQNLTPKIAAKYGFRPGDPTKKALAPITKQNGLDPAKPTRVLGLPEPAVLAKIKAAWHADRKPANVMLVVDTSGSMYDEGKLTQAKKGLQVFLKQLSPRDNVGLTWFSSNIHQVVPIQPFAQDKSLLERSVAGLTADGDTALLDATYAGVKSVEALKDTSKINAIVVLSDGQDTASKLNLRMLLNRLNKGGKDEGHRVRVFTIAYGKQADVDAMAKMAEAGGGKAYTGDTTNIESVYISISSFF